MKTYFGYLILSLTGFGLIRVGIGNLLAGSLFWSTLQLSLGALCAILLVYLLITRLIAAFKEEVHIKGLWNGKPVDIRFRSMPDGTPSCQIFGDDTQLAYFRPYTLRYDIDVTKEVTGYKDKNAVARIATGAVIAGRTGAVIGAISARGKKAQVKTSNGWKVTVTQLGENYRFTNCSNPRIAKLFLQKF